jgi:hypothetical protein
MKGARRIDEAIATLGLAFGEFSRTPALTFLGMI